MCLQDGREEFKEFMKQFQCRRSMWWQFIRLQLFLEECTYAKKKVCKIDAKIKMFIASKYDTYAIKASLIQK